MRVYVYLDKQTAVALLLRPSIFSIKRGDSDSPMSKTKPHQSDTPYNLHTLSSKLKIVTEQIFCDALALSK